MSKVRVLSESAWAGANANSVPFDNLSIASGLSVPRGAHVLIAVGYGGYGAVPERSKMHPAAITTQNIPGGTQTSVAVQALTHAIPAGLLYHRDNTAQTVQVAAAAAGATALSITATPGAAIPSGSVLFTRTGPRTIGLPAAFTEVAFAGEWAEQADLYMAWNALVLYRNTGPDITLGAIPIQFTGSVFSSLLSAKAFVLGGVDAGGDAGATTGLGAFTSSQVGTWTDPAVGITAQVQATDRPGSLAVASAIAVSNFTNPMGTVSVTPASTISTYWSAEGWPIVALREIDAPVNANEDFVYKATQWVEKWAWASMGIDAATVTDANAPARTSVGATTITVGSIAIPVVGSGAPIRAAVGGTTVANMGQVTGSGKSARAAVGTPSIKLAGTGLSRIEYGDAQDGDWVYPDINPMGATGTSLASNFCAMPLDGTHGGPWNTNGFGNHVFTAERSHSSNGLSVRPSNEVLTKARVDAHPETGLVWDMSINPPLGAPKVVATGYVLPTVTDSTVVPSPAYSTGTIHQSAHFYFEEYPPVDMGLLWFVDNYPSGFLIGETTMVGMCPWGRFEIWSPYSGEVKTETFAIPLNQWFRVEVLVDMQHGGDGGKITARLYRDPEAPADQFDYEIVSGPGDLTTERRPPGDSRSIVVYQPFAFTSQAGDPNWCGNDGPHIGDIGGASGLGSWPMPTWDDMAIGDSTTGWIGPSGNAVTQRSSYLTTAAVGTPTIALVEDPGPDIGTGDTTGEVTVSGSASGSAIAAEGTGGANGVVTISGVAGGYVVGPDSTGSAAGAVSVTGTAGGHAIHFASAVGSVAINGSARQSGGAIMVALGPLSVESIAPYQGTSDSHALRVRIKRGDLLPNMRVRLLNGGTPFDLSDATSVRCIAAKRSGAVLLDRTMTIEPQADDTLGVVNLDWQESDTETAGEWRLEFEANIAGKAVTFPDQGYGYLTIAPDLG